METIEDIKKEFANSIAVHGSVGDHWEETEDWFNRIILANERSKWHPVSQLPGHSDGVITDDGLCWYNHFEQIWLTGPYDFCKPTIWRELPTIPEELK